MKSRKIIATITLATLFLSGALVGCGSANSTATSKSTKPIQTTSSSTPTAIATETVTVGMGNMVFNPAVIHVKTGTKVIWKNNDTIAHTVTSGANRSSDGKYDSKDLQPGKSFSYTFMKPGSYDYFCVYHPDMNGTVIVSDDATNPTETETMAAQQTSKDKIAAMGTGLQGEPQQKDDIYLLPYTTENGYKVFHLTAEPVWVSVQKGKRVEAWAFNGSVPGPEIKVNQGDKVKIEVTNQLPEGTSVHWHGLDVPFSMDGVGGLSQPPIQPGATFTYSFTVNATPGTYAYHSHPMADMMKQESMGLFGPFIVEPKGTGWQQVHPGYQDEYTIVLNDSSEFGYNLNGKSFPATPVLPAKTGDNILVHLLNLGDMNHPMHLHGFHFKETEQDGVPLPAPVTMDTIDTAPGTTYDLAFNANQPGEWLFHCHVVSHVTSGTQMSGMITLFDVK
jgi:manganese oxidase